MEIGDIKTISIESLGAKGDGIAEVEGKKLIVPFALPGEKAEVEIKNITPAAISTEIISLSEFSSSRQPPPCIHFYKCGGCHLQHMEAEFYKNFKKNLFLKSLERAEIILEAPEIEIIGPYTRRRATFKVSVENSAIELGFFENNSHRIVNIRECHILEPEIFGLSQKIKPALSNLSSPEKIKEILITDTDSGLDILLYAQYEPQLKDIESLKNFSRGNNIARISWKFSDEITPVIINRPVIMKFGAIDVRLPDEPFLQPTKLGQEILTREVVNGLANTKNIIDLFSGCGTYSFPLAKKSSVHAVEGGDAMVNAVKNASAKSGVKVTAERRNLNSNPVSWLELNSYSGAVINPPRPGALNQCKMLAKSKIPRVVMVSCNPDTFSRDAKILLNGGYKAERALAIDQFQWSSHLEIAALFTK